MSCPVASLYLAILKMPDDSLALAATPGVPDEQRFLRKLHAVQLLAAMVSAELGEVPSSDPLGAVATAAQELVLRCRAFRVAVLAETARISVRGGELS